MEPPEAESLLPKDARQPSDNDGFVVEDLFRNQTSEEAKAAVEENRQNTGYLLSEERTSTFAKVVQEHPSHADDSNVKSLPVKGRISPHLKQGATLAQSAQEPSGLHRQAEHPAGENSLNFVPNGSSAEEGGVRNTLAKLHSETYQSKGINPKSSMAAGSNQDSHHNHRGVTIQSVNHTSVTREPRNGTFDEIQIDLDLDPLGLGLSLEGRQELSQEQMKRLRQLQNPMALYDLQGNLLENEQKMAEQYRRNKQSYFILRKWSMPVEQYINILIGLLIVALFVERFCFAVVVYKTKNYGLDLVMIMMIFNSIFLYFIQRLRKKKHKKRLHELYNLDRTPRVGLCAISIIGLVDMLKAFFLIWPANVMPLWLLISLLQLFIPLNLMLRSCCIEEVSHKWIHWLMSLVILAGAIYNMFGMSERLVDPAVSENYQYYSVMIIISVLLDVVSHTIKEVLVRSQPLNQEKFNFRVSVFQVFIVLIAMPFVKITQPRAADDSPFADPKYDKMHILEYTKYYLKFGFQCLFDFSGEETPENNMGECQGSWLYVIGYTLSLFVIQLNLNSIMHHKFTRKAQLVYSLIVPLTFLAFLLASKDISTIDKNNLSFSHFDVVGLIVVGLGVFVFNLFPEKEQRASIEEDL